MRMLSLRSALIGLLLLNLAPALRSAVPAWTKVQAPIGAKFALESRVYQTDTRWVIEFRNDSAKQVHFNFRFRNLQNRKEGRANGRIHLNAGSRAQIPLPVLAAAKAIDLVAAPVHAYRVRLGLIDQGEPEADSD